MRNFICELSRNAKITHIRFRLMLTKPPTIAHSIANANKITVN